MGNERSKGRDNRLNGAFRDCIGAGNELKFKRHTRLTVQQNHPFLMLPFWKVLSSHTLRCRRRSQSIGQLREPEFDARMRGIPITLLFTGTGQREKGSSLRNRAKITRGVC